MVCPKICPTCTREEYICSAVARWWYLLGLVGYSVVSFFNLFFYWRITALQNFVVFCQTSTWISHVAAASKSSQSCPTLCDPTDGSPPGSAVPGILQARELKWAAIASPESAIGVHMSPLPLEPPSHLSPHPTLLGWFRILIWEFPEPYSKLPLTIYCTYDNASLHVTFSIHLTLSTPLMSIYSVVSFLTLC